MMINPVLSRELTERMRGPRAMVVLTVYLGLLGLIVLLVYQSNADPSADPFGAPVVTQVATIGQGLFEWVLFFMLLLVLFLVPGFTSGAIAGERERQTLLPLQVTLLRPLSILVGKVASSLVFTLLLVLASVPLLAVGYLIGGVTITDILGGTGLILCIAVAVACVTVACSTFAKRVQTATVLAYGIVLLVAGGSIAAFLVARAIDSSRGVDTVDPPLAIVMMNPVAALADLSGESPYRSFDQVGFSPFGPVQDQADAPLTALRDLFAPDVFGGNEGGFAVAEPAIAVGGGAVINQVFIDDFGNPVPQTATDEGWLPLWADHLVLVGAVGILALLAAARRLRTPATTER